VKGALPVAINAASTYSESKIRVNGILNHTED
jgi:hypothetical protein